MTTITTEANLTTDPELRFTKKACGFAITEASALGNRRVGLR
jgi:hypothetical protein